MHLKAWRNERPLTMSAKVVTSGRKRPMLSTERSSCGSANRNVQESVPSCAVQKSVRHSGHDAGCPVSAPQLGGTEWVSET